MTLRSYSSQFTPYDPHSIGITQRIRYRITMPKITRWYNSFTVRYWIVNDVVLIDLSMEGLDCKWRPVLVLSLSFHNGLHVARLLVVSLSFTTNNIPLHRLFISPENTRGQVIKNKSNILFDYTSVVSHKYLKPTHKMLFKITSSSKH